MKQICILFFMAVAAFRVAGSNSSGSDAMAACSASGGCGEYISRVTLGSIDNSSVCGGYQDFTYLSATIPINSPLLLTVTNGVTLYPSDQCVAWVDWNQDGDFSGPGETITMVGSPGIGPYNASIDPPDNAVLGYTILRIRIGYLGPLSPCGSTANGEVEDYLVYVAPPVPNSWTGAISQSWHDPGNWSLGHVPVSAETVNITANGFQPVLTGSVDVFCSELNVEAGGILHLGNNLFEVAGSVNIYGNLSVTNSSNWFRVGGEWHNHVGPSGFSAGSGRVILTGTAAPNLFFSTSENFNFLDLNIPGTLEIINATVVCNTYDWINGTLIVGNNATFTALHVWDNGISGNLTCNGGGTVNLYNNLNGFMDLNGNLTINGGTVNLTGAYCEWAYSHDASINMSSGVLDVRTCGIGISQGSYSLVSNITGGTIRTSQGFSSNRPDFVTAGGTVELYGSSDASVSVTNGSRLFNLLVNKLTPSDQPWAPVSASISRRNIRNGDAPASNMVTLGADLNIDNDLLVESGTLSLNGHTATVTGSTHIWGSLSMTHPADVLHNGNWELGYLYFYSGSVSIFTAGTIHQSAWVWLASGATVNSTTGHTIVFTGNYNQGIEITTPGSTFGNIVINRTGGNLYLNCFDPAMLEVAGNLTIHGGNTLKMQGSSVIVRGDINCHTSGVVRLNDLVADHMTSGIITRQGSRATSLLTTGGELTVDGIFQLNGSLYIPGATVTVHGMIVTSTTSMIHLSDNGSFLFDAPNSTPGLGIPVYGNLTIQSGTFELTHYGFSSGSSSSTVLMADGFLKAGGGFMAMFPGNFQPTGGTVVLTGPFDGEGLNLAGGNYFHNLTIHKTSGTGVQILPAEIAVRGNLVIQSGYLSALPDRSLRAGRDWINETGTSGFIPGTGTVTFDGTNISNLYGDQNFYHLRIDKTGITPYASNAQGNVVVNGLFEILQGKFVTNMLTSLTTGNSLIHEAGYLELLGLSVMRIRPGQALDVYGELFSHGLFGNTVILESTIPEGYYALNLRSGSRIAAAFTQFRNLDAAGVNLHPGSLATSWGPEYQFYSCTFSDGAPGGTLLTVNNNENFSIQYALFPANAWGGASNVTKGVNAGHVEFLNYYGEFGGEDFDQDPNNRVTWVPFSGNVNGSIPAGNSQCYSATNTLTIAGGGNTFAVNPGASATLIAGQMISFLEGTTVLPGGYLHAYITPNGQYCGSIAPALPSAPAEETTAESVFPEANVLPFIIFPNPAYGFSTLRCKGEGRTGHLRAEIFNLHGDRIRTFDFQDCNDCQLDLREFPAGLYLVRIASHGTSENLKLIVTERW